MQIIYCDQYTDEWFNLRGLRMTASHAQAIGNNGTGLKTYIYDLLSEYFSGSDAQNFENDHTKRGIEMENAAATAYQLETNYDAKKCGFVIYNDFVGCSPDLLVNDDGLAEIKCPSDKHYFRMFDNIDTKYIWQMQMQMLCCDRKWCDFVAYNPNFDNHLIIKRFYPDQTMVDKLLDGFKIGKNMIKSISKKYKSI